jgi:hypothetical protein
VGATGTAPLAYQWRFNGAPISGQTSGALPLTNTLYANAGNYDVIVTNGYGAITSSVATLTVVDTTAPVEDVISLPDVAGQCSATVTAPSAHDACEGLIMATTTDPLSYTAQGDFTVHWSYKDSHGNSSSQNQTVRVHDTTAPAITMLGNSPVTVECHGAYTDAGATASDNCDGNITGRIVTHNPVNPASPGTYTVTYDVSDAAGNAATQITRTVNVVDTTPPSITCSSNISVFTTNNSGVAVSFTTTAFDLCSGPATVVCNPASGSIFPIGTTTVQCTATDANNNQTNCSFTVTVLLNHAPVADNITLGAVENHPRSLLIEKLLAHASDMDDDVLTISAVSATSTNGGTVTLGTTNVIYMPATNFVGADLFTYTVSDGRGGFATASVAVTVTSENALTLNRIGSLTVNQGTVTIHFAGIPGNTYTVERSTDMLAWSPIGSFTVPDNGIAQFTDSNPPAGQGFYRTASASP